MPEGHPGDAALMQVVEALREQLGIAHTTLQIETDPTTACPQKSAGVV
jgi:cobalt-zinc-cadmium efflux system protein